MVGCGVGCRVSGLGGFLPCAEHILRGFISLLECGNFLRNSILLHFEIGRANSSHVISLFIRNGHIQLHHGNDNADDIAPGLLGTVLRSQPNGEAGEENQSGHARECESSGHDSLVQPIGVCTKMLPSWAVKNYDFVIPSGARNLSWIYTRKKKERFLAPLGMTKNIELLIHS